MPSPFPGMDPYLEAPGLWPDVHHELMSVARESLNARLRPKYHVRVEERVYISDENDPGRKVIIPDLQIHDTGAQYSRSLWTPETAASTATLVEPVLLTTLIEDEMHESYLEIVDHASRSVVTVIEVLRPTNKVAGSRGRASYEQKRQETMRSPTHLVEIDLLRDGVSLHAREILPPADYYVHVSRRGQRPRGLVWPILLPQRLPVIGIPLLPDDPDVSLDLQAVLNTAYERAAYDLEIDYQQSPVPPLPSRYEAWAQKLTAASRP
jgi:Protein of unknown function (DUF4058)